ncbi:hypothetical protein N7448_004529 [Penicillium atrosanguineum]|uniref:Uncharacterized protein n=1 Tax=Penicillium atrosanguineum TaxID=1132637 RepID=A0A9W9PQ59_9EURO|nr:DNA topoisomerase II eukaryotic-type [Penicillium atrosanguineum]KAJ5125204.1 hypothetical protein N7526_007381 [Penicillium atrosanguineum]KAJ5135975.1 hypothetical protein N7448_004529 [Penicillium atrosanguineum]KAJ5292329.1 DNA topoisomerase II eukaryotic-type [Penicillium atrosanguineum]KAJ5303651.1 hypothetical protein N7476_010450 [Penicillium atrosanguineum]
MTFREKVRRVFHRSSSSVSNGKPKVEYYRRHEIPPSKFRGPFDKEHQKRLAAWSFEAAMADRPRSLDLSLSPYATYDLPPSDNDTEDVSPDDDGVAIDPVCSDAVSPIDIDSSRPTNAGSQSSTVVNSESYSGSMMTLLGEPSIYEASEDPIAQIKESIRYTSPIVRAITPASPRAMSPRGKHQTFTPEDLTRALVAVQVCA